MLLRKKSTWTNLSASETVVTFIKCHCYVYDNSVCFTRHWSIASFERDGSLILMIAGNFSEREEYVLQMVQYFLSLVCKVAKFVRLIQSVLPSFMNARVFGHLWWSLYWSNFAADQHWFKETTWRIPSAIVVWLWRNRLMSNSLTSCTLTLKIVYPLAAAHLHWVFQSIS